MEIMKTAKLPATPRQLSLTFETRVLRSLAPAEKRAAMMALVELLVEASGLMEERDDNEY